MACAAQAFASGGLRTVALSGTPAPGLGAGTNLDFFNNPVLNNNGQVAFSASLTGTGVNLFNNETIFSEAAGGGLALVAREGSDAPGIGGDVILDGAFSATPLISDQGHTLFRSLLDGTGVGGTNDSALFLQGANGVVSLVARAGGTAAGAGGAQFRNFFEPVLNASGQVAFRSSLSNGGQGVFSTVSGTLASIAVTGDDAVGIGGGVEFEAFLRNPALSDNGQLVFQAFLQGPGVVNDNDNMNDNNEIGNNEVLYSVAANGGLTLLARELSAAPGLGGATFEIFPGRASLNNSGQAAFRAEAEGGGVSGNNDNAIFSQAQGGGLSVLVREGDDAPGIAGNVDFDFFDDPVLNGAGQVAFVADLGGAGVNETNDRAVFRSAAGGGAVSLVIREGVAAPGAGAGVNLGTPDDLVINSSGQIAFGADLAGPSVDLSNDFAIFATDDAGDVRLIVREGDTIDVSDDPQAPDPRTVASLGFVDDTSNEDGRGSGFNDAGQVAFFATFTDDSEGVFVSSLLAAAPELFGDYNDDGFVDAADYTVFRDLVGSSTPLPNDATPGGVALEDYGVFAANFGEGTPPANAGVSAAAVPEPGGAALALLAVAGWRRRR